MPNAEVWLHTNASTTMIDHALQLQGLAPLGNSNEAKADANRDYNQIIKAEYNEY